jgi:hypothetical protein
MNFYIKGEFSVVLVDDYLPFNKNKTTLIYARTALDGGFWVAFIEKAWAKVNGNYEAIISGAPSEVF